MPRAVLQTTGEPETTFDVGGPRTLGGGEHDEVSIAGLGERALIVSGAVGGLLVEALVPTTICGRLVPPGTRRLVRPGERVDGDGWALWPEPADAPPDGTRAVLAAALAGVAVTSPDGPGVTVLEGPAAGTRFPVGSATVVGRSGRVDVTIADPLASRRHLVLERRDGITWARDLGSKNGFTVWRREGDAVRSQRIRRGRVRLVPGDELEIGRTLIAYDEVKGPLSCPLPQGGEGDRSSSALDVQVSSPREAGRARERGIVRAAVLLASLALLVAAALLAHAAA